MQLAQQGLPARPVMPSPSARDLHVNLILEELVELEEAFKQGDMVEAYDAIIDLLYVTVGAASAMGLEIEPGWNEVQRSNLSKFIDGHRRADGKWVKGPSYSPANLKAIVKEQLR